MSERARAVVDRIAVTAGVLEATRNGVLILDLKDRILVRNASLLRICGLSVEEPGDRGLAALNDALASQLVAPLPPSMTSSLRPGAEEASRLHLLRFQDGRHYERHISDWVVEGAVVGVVFVFNDVTRLALTEQALARDREFLEKAQEVAHIGSWTMDVDGAGALEWSPEMFRILGVPPGTVRSRAQALGEMVHPDDRDLVRRTRDQARRSNEPYAIEHRIIRPDGTTRWVQTRAEVVSAADGRPTRVVGTMQDITDRYALEEQLRHAQRLEGLGRLAGGVAHDLNNALNVITGYTEVLLEETSGHPGIAADLAEIRRATERAAATVRQLLAFSRKKPASRLVFRLDESIASLKGMIERLFGPEIAISVEAAPDLPPISGDPGQIEQALFNLATNARDAMPQGGRLMFRVDETHVDAALAEQNPELRAGHYITVQVSDTGHGIPSDVLSRIFDPFFTTKDVGQGSGLGLPMVYGTVKQSGGAIAVESTPEVGTTFRLYFPVSDGTVGRELPLPAAAALAATVLVVDDEKELLQLTSTTLSRAGYRVLSAASGREALEIAGDEPRLDVLLTDLRMPGLHGRELARALRAIHPETQVVLMSGFVSDLPDTLDALRLEKPFTQSALREAVQQAVRLGARVVD